MTTVSLLSSESDDSNGKEQSQSNNQGNAESGGIMMNKKQVNRKCVKSSYPNSHMSEEEFKAMIVSNTELLFKVTPDDEELNMDWDRHVFSCAYYGMRGRTKMIIAAKQSAVLKSLTLHMRTHYSPEKIEERRLQKEIEKTKQHDTQMDHPTKHVVPSASVDKTEQPSSNEQSNSQSIGSVRDTMNEKGHSETATQGVGEREGIIMDMIRVKPKRLGKKEWVEDYIRNSMIFYKEMPSKQDINRTYNEVKNAGKKKRVKPNPEMSEDEHKAMIARNIQSMWGITPDEEEINRDWDQEQFDRQYRTIRGKQKKEAFLEYAASILKARYSPEKIKERRLLKEIEKKKQHDTEIDPPTEHDLNKDAA